MYSFLTLKENLNLVDWNLYKQKKQPLYVFANENPNLIVIHKTITESNKRNLSIRESLDKSIAIIEMNRYLIEQISEEILSLPAEDLKNEIDTFHTFLENNRSESKWMRYANLHGKSSVSFYRFGSDYLDVIFSTSPNYYYHYSYSLTTILVTETLKALALQGRYLGTNTRRIERGMFEKYPLYPKEI